jgi:hypothetical protein
VTVLEQVARAPKADADALIDVVLELLDGMSERG